MRICMSLLVWVATHECLAAGESGQILRELTRSRVLNIFPGPIGRVHRRVHARSLYTHFQILDFVGVVPKG